MMPPPTGSAKQQQVDGLPVFDPTERTLQQLLRDVATSRDIIEARIDGIQTNVEVRLHERDKAIDLLQHASSKIPDLIAQCVQHLREVHEEKFASIATQFIERDTRTEQTSKDSKTAVDAALQAAKEAVGEQNKSNAQAISKSEASFTKQIDQIGQAVSTMGKNLDGKIDDVKGRIQAIESQRKGQGDIWSVWFGVTGIVVAMISIGVAIVAVLINRSR
jgi:hypothetical protein